jgi:hypothetical protein
LARLARLAGGSAGSAAGATLTALTGLTAGSGCPTVATGPAVSAGAPFSAGTAFSTGAAFAARAVAAVTTVAARIVGCEAGTAGMHDAYAAHSVAARGRSGAQSDQCRSQSHPGSRAQVYGVNYLV